MSAIVLPVGGVLPQPEAALVLADVAAAIDRALALLAEGPSEPESVARALASAAAFAGSRAGSRVVAQPEAAAQRDAIVAAAPGPMSDDELANFAIYDAYFGVTRATLGTRDYASVLLGAWSALFADLGRALIGRDEIEALLRAFRAMLERIGSIEGVHDAVATIEPAAVTPPPLCSDDGVPWRWRGGHYAFALCAMHARDAFATTLADGARVETALQTAALMTRAAAAAQWYASEFPIETYLGVVRPGMERSGARGGFSGTQNADYRCMQWMRERAIERLFERFGTAAAAWPASTHAALMALREVEIEAAEHHVLVAASKVRLDGSLAQKALADPTPAVTALREKVEEVADDISGRFDTAPAVRRIRVCAVGDVPAERPLGVSVEGKDVVLVRAYGAIWACAGICTHAGGELAEGHIAGNAIVCPLHGAKFDPRTGAVLHPPATEPLAAYPVTVDGADVFVDV